MIRKSTGSIWTGKSEPGKICIAVTILLFASALFVEVKAHTPYGQWDSFRQRHLQVLTSRSDLTGDAYADTWVAVLAEHLPKSKAVVSRARNFVRVASLLKTDQAKLAVLSYSEAKAMLDGAAPFEDFGPMPIQLLVDNGSHLLVARSDLPLEHGYLLVATLLEQATELHLSVPMQGKLGLTLHPGGHAAASGEPLQKED